jgi:aspartate carbamoyltransferase catalytic subunit
MRHLLSVDDLSNSDIDVILDQARAFAASSLSIDSQRRVLGLLFLEESLRTRVGFGSAAIRLGWSPQTIDTLRVGPTSMAESWSDTIRTLSGLVDAMVIRPAMPIDRAAITTNSDVPVINGGDRGPLAEHPSQALIDMYAIEREWGAIANCTVALCGDLRMRSARSLLKLFARRSPHRIVAITSDQLIPDDALHLERREPWELHGVDVLYVVGIPHEALPLDERARLLIDTSALRQLPPEAIVLSPMPVIDELSPEAKLDSRIKLFEQNRASIAVRMAVLTHVFTSNS